ncbi:hypothetical protein P167DRAFT_538955 [Morchella conica CCBAS932]|uniref:Uncharacterized protein n=1 Tax=Morchella conica CCBAS932 TaxID=1392247 RepID=A0A3N4KKE6_9PEZI|nr:hypothetical protein P167DRAFT_538955 [Morchella conica CCBAS932]
MGEVSFRVSNTTGFRTAQAWGQDIGFSAISLGVVGVGSVGVWGRGSILNGNSNNTPLSFPSKNIGALLCFRSKWSGW